ncbi:hypothetical protein [Hasllibacter sp. MH4015]|uniref:hypothetical protein n=1 Tax=Hasllibacter sp. MH4015 TaxID=2854029 RepID=UPI001CD55C93|nr:hypothetical protein [Hasllibacter sp. MH4015]
MTVPDVSQILNVVVFLLFVGGILDASRTYLQVFKRYGGFENFLPSHLAATLFSFFRFALYFFAAAVVFAIAGRI